MVKKFLLTLLLLCFFSLGGLAGVVYWFVVVEPGPEIQADNIHKILAKESHVFYSDGETKLGVFFDKAHRQYIEYGEIPSNFINALIASEDNKFFTHYGFDIFGITRALIKNIQAGRVVQGGSTITQQTAKNLFKRSGRSYQEKLKELLYALRLEYHFSKEKILEFYVNQFYVSGNGHGLGVAARYYFDKVPKELNLLECAFIAGSVKRPNYYNPLRKDTEASAELARSRTQVRVKYVLEKMLELGMIDSFTFNETIEKEVMFNKGKVGFDLDYGMELVRDAVSSTEVLKALEENNIPNIATSGARIITTLDMELQSKTLATLRGELSRLDVRLRGYERDEVQKELNELDYKGDSIVAEEQFVFGTIQALSLKNKDVRIVVDFDNNLGQGVISKEGLAKLVRARTKYLKNRWSEPGKSDTQKLFNQLQKGDRVWVKILEIGEDDFISLSLEKFPLVQGAALVLKEGLIKAMAGGVENRFYNRALHARRTMGSSFKPLVYTAALQLGWNSVDNLKNTRDVFIYHGKPYFPRPDHKSPHEWVSMSWAGVHSENVASVWLLSHLCDQLTPLQFKEVAEHVGLTPKIVDGEEEPYRSYKARIRDRYGIKVNRRNLRKTAYKLAVKNVETDFIFDGMAKEYKKVKELHFGLDYDTFHNDIKEQLHGGRKFLKQYEIEELKLRQNILENSFLTLEETRRQLGEFREYFDNSAYTSSVEPFDTSKHSLYYKLDNGEYYYLPTNTDIQGMKEIDEFELGGYLQELGVAESASFWENIRLNGDISIAAFDRVLAQTEHDYKKLLSELPYSFEVLSQLDDFRITVGLYYIIEFSKQLGIRSGLEPVLSFPLGSNVITLYEATKMYEALVTGVVNDLIDSSDQENSDNLAILDRIESADGEIVYQVKTHRKSIVDKKTSLAIGSILENIVKFGTGRKADKQIRLRDKDAEAQSEMADLDLAVPVLGKTGTANRYTNATFLGYLPGVTQNGVALEIMDGYAVGVYAGYDKNQAMRRKSTRISGAQGALPTWIGIVNTLLQEQEYTSKLDAVDLTFNGLGISWEPLGQINVAVDPEQGGQLVEPVSQIPSGSRYRPSIITFGRKTETGRFIKDRNFNPFWRVDH